ncbi:nuclear transport factor 2 family protein [Amycolatopsis sp. GM8]|uniref:nuclear transport factor 2 family protein n=1 Tax=Amycolatopsis sp. GM8 TaxID=2896530 RepID=UPI001F187832|nr:nuclear transport factor 2 family protein [Amycolatopsis sp. GM8]
MTLTSNEIGSRHAVTAAAAFFDAYRDRDVETMVGLCSDTAVFEYIPFEMWGRQRVMRGAGKVATIGKALWSGFIAAFPDLTNTVQRITADDAGNIAAQVVLAGTQAAPWGTIANQGQRFSEPHLFVMHTDDAGLLDSITAYWDCAGVSRQLGHLEVD